MKNQHSLSLFEKKITENDSQKDPPSIQCNWRFCDTFSFCCFVISHRKRMMKFVLFFVFGVIASSAFRVDLEPEARPNFVPPEWNKISRAHPERHITLLVGLKPRNTDILQKVLYAAADPSSESYGKWLSKSTVDNLIAPTRETEKNVRTWLQSEGLLTKKNQLHHRTKLWWEVKCTVGEAQRMLGVTFFVFAHQDDPSKEIVRATQHYSVPEEIASSLTLIGNVFRFPGKRVTPKISEDDDRLTITPPILLDRYNVTVPPPVSSNLQSVGSFLDQYYSPTDLDLFRDDFFPGANCQIEKTIGGNDASDPGIEAALDTEYIQWGNCTVATWDYSTAGETPPGNEPFLNWLFEVDQECTLGECPYVYSLSYGDYENTITPAYAYAIDLEFQALSATGRTFLAASGDGGVGCADIGYGPGSYNCSYFNSIFVSTSPHVLSCGATTSSSLERNAGFSGGGFSDLFLQPFYQVEAVNQYFSQGEGIPSTSFFNKNGRGFPDVGVAGTNFVIYWSGRKITVDGTSASTPAMASMVSMMNNVRFASGLPPMGLINPFLYQAWGEHATAFTDVTQGQTQSHGCCPKGFDAVPGWEPVCGLGAPNYGILTSLAVSQSFIPAFA